MRHGATAYWLRVAVTVCAGALDLFRRAKSAVNRRSCEVALSERGARVANPWARYRCKRNTVAGTITSVSAKHVSHMTPTRGADDRSVVIVAQAVRVEAPAMVLPPCCELNMRRAKILHGCVSRE